jgi:signal transduction histidine kinase
MLFENSLPSDFIYLNVNKAFETLTGLINVEGKRATEVIPGIKESDNSLFEIYSRVALTGKPEIFEMHVESLNDWYSVSVYSPKREFFIAVFDVITERKLSEQELINAKEKAEESDRLKTAFLNNISHEIRTPFNGILGFLSLLQDHDLEDDEREEYIGIINQSADRLMNTINDIVEVSHIQSGLVKLAMQNTNIKQLTDDLIDKFGAFAEKKELEFIITNDLPNNITSISTDGIKLKTILTNLIGNALKFTRIGSVELCLKKKNDILEFSVKDTGIGISKNKQQIIFERFMQSTVSNTREFEGLGLGLTIVKAYVEMLGGKLWMESEEGKGTTFNFTIPYIDNTDK